LLNAAMPLPHGVTFDLRLDRHGEDKRTVRTYTLWLRVAGQDLPRLYRPYLPLARLHRDLPAMLEHMLLAAWNAALEATYYREAVRSQADYSGLVAGYVPRWVATLKPAAAGWALEAVYRAGTPYEARLNATSTRPTLEYGWQELVRLLPVRVAIDGVREAMYSL
jgi:hypothetical protein